MTKILYFDCFSGIAGDMILGSLIDLGVDEKFLKKELERLPLAGYGLSVKQVESHHIRAVDVTVTITQEQCPRNLFDLFTMLEESTLEKEVVKSCKLIFQRLAHAESKIHGISVEEVHFHEVGAVDSIIDIVGSVIGLKSLDVGEMHCSPLPLGRGFVTCAHGVLPLPAPATMELLKDVPVYSVDRSQELVTPTGAAIVTTLASGFGGMPSMVVKKIGYGNGKIPSEYPSVLRAVLGESSSKSVQEQGSGTKQEKMKRGKKDH